MHYLFIKAIHALNQDNNAISVGKENQFLSKLVSFINEILGTMLPTVSSQKIRNMSRLSYEQNLEVDLSLREDDFLLQESVIWIIHLSWDLCS